MKSDDIRNACFVARVAGMLMTMAGMRGATITDTMSLELEHAAENMDLVMSDLVKKALESDEPKIEINGVPSYSEMIKELKKMQVDDDVRRATEIFGRVYPGQEEARADQ